MPIYQYSCKDCSGDVDENMIVDMDNETDGFHPNGEFLFFKTYKMADKKKSPKCPKCGGNNTFQSYLDNYLTCYIRGNGIVKDRSGARRDMNRHHLVNQDPYGHMRQSGEVDDMLSRMNYAGLDMGKIHSKRAAQSARAKNVARSVEDKKLSEDENRVLMLIDEDNGSVYDDFKHIEDVNKVLSNLMNEYICKNGDRFKLLALGRRYVDDLKSS